MKRREVLLGLAAAALGNVPECALHAQPAPNMLHVAAVLMTPPTASYWIAFMRRLRELGYRDGENLLVEALGAGSRHQPVSNHLIPRQLIKRFVNVNPVSPCPERRFAGTQAFEFGPSFAWSIGRLEVAKRVVDLKEAKALLEELAA